ncbi:prothoracicotropic hormone-like [Anticarsia gemmatalis]|uniref:prothoracicotropic hormone-like n=1 Tax=Anticarsia gemmatalis TaxID=129554 RepID=UPI003F7689F6
MITRPLVLVIVCFGFFVFIQLLVPKVMALKRSSNVNEFMLEDQRTRKRKNYVVKIARDNRDSEMLGSTDLGPSYDTEPFQSDSKPEELSAFIVDYANMIRNDVILLDNSVETRTRKRGNIKVKKFNQAIPDPPCNCESVRNKRDFGENVYPRNIEIVSCSSRQQHCLPPYVCKENMYNITIIRRRTLSRHDSLELPGDLKTRWFAEHLPISVGCICARDYHVQNSQIQE